MNYLINSKLFNIKQLRLVFPLLLFLLLEIDLAPIQVHVTDTTTIANQEVSVGYVSSGVLALQPVYPLSSGTSIWEVRNMPEPQRIVSLATCAVAVLQHSKATSYEKLSRYLSVSLTKADIVFPFHWFW
ncbi:MAG: hypothetical protein KBF73_01215 [Flavobacteriales bacterium]|nr:hypothetical protein [Flavobacteriales bacterium]